MNKNIFRRHRTSLAITLALASFSGLQVANAGSGWGDSADAVGNPIKTATYYANSPSGLLPDIDCYDTAPPSTGEFSSLITPPAQTKTAAQNSLCDSGNPLRKFVDPVGSIPVAVADTATYPGSDYYEIGVVEYKQQMHSDLSKATGGTTLRGYVQLATSVTGAGDNVALTYLSGGAIMLPNGSPAIAVAKPTYLGPIISSTSGKPVRIKFVNLLPAGTAGNLHLPVDETITGAGLGPDGKTKYQQNRVEIHLHGGDNPWISDGTPHQWILPAADEIALKAAKHPEMARGVSARNVPDMPDPGPGAMTYYFPNNQSGRLMFYHDHSLGITRLNVYAGIAAGYLIRDIDGVGENHPSLSPLLPAGKAEIPLVIQDKTFVAKNIAMQDAKWDSNSAKEGDLWYPHVYETNQDPNSYDGTNPVGRWDWGSWFWPVFPSAYPIPTGEMKAVATNAPVNSTTKVSNVSTTPEAYMDTALVNGVAYPTLNVEPKAYRFRVLNAANDRFMNLGFYLAADKNTTDANTPLNSANTVVCDGISKRTDGTIPATTDCTEVKMVNFDASYKVTSTPSPDAEHVIAEDPTSPIGFPTTGGISTFGWGAQVSGLFPQGAPDPATAGPHIVQIGNEGGLLAAPLDIPSTPLNYEYNKRSVTVLNVEERGLYLGPAERADVLVDFTAYAGKTLILYNDAPAPDPASDPRIDYFTGNGDQTGVGGTTNTMPGYGPNTRTVMQIVVGSTATAGTGAATVDLGSLQTALPKAFASSQPMPIVPQPEFNAAYPKASYPGYSAPAARNNIRIYTGSVYLGAYKGVSFTAPEPINYFPAPTCSVATGTAATTCSSIVAAQAKKANGGLVTAAAGTVVNAYVQSKAIQELFDPVYGRMNATLGVELPFTSALTQTTIPLGYVDPITETVADGETQFWKITHNGVDAHPVHFHLVNVQVLNRVGWDGTIKAPYGDEFGWKDTVKMNPLEDIVVAVRAKKPLLKGVTAADNKTAIPSNAFGLPISERLNDPSQPANSAIGFTQVDPVTGNPATVTNTLQKYGWEYVWHCHILGHEENDFMRPVKFDANEIAAAAPTGLAATAGATGVVLNWTDKATTEYAYKVERGETTTKTTIVRGRPVTTTSTAWTDLTALVTPAQQVSGSAPLANANTFTDTTASTVAGTVYQYRVSAIGANGSGMTPAITYTVAAAPPVAPTAPTNVSIQRTATNAATLSWTDASNNEKTFQVQTLNAGNWVNVTQGSGLTVTRANAAAETSTGTGLTATVTVSNTTNASYRVLVTGDATAPAVGLTAASAVVTLNDTVAPSAATGLAATKAPVTTTRRGVTTRTGTDVMLTWTDVANNNATYTLQRKIGTGAWTNVSTNIAGNVFTYTDSIGNVTATTNQYQLLAVNSVGNATSNPVSITLP